MQTVKGYVSDIIFRNKENQYTVFEVTQDGRTITCVGFPAQLSEGETVTLTGEMVTHPAYGEQLKVSSCEISEPEGTEAVLRYLGSGAVKGIGQALAARIVKKFGEDTLRILDEEPERLSEVKGISAAGARAIAAQLEEKRGSRDAMIFLQQYGLGGRRAVKIWETYGQEVYQILKENPYRLAEDITGIGFATADAIAAKAGIRPDSDFRIRSGILFILSETLQGGSTWLPRSELVLRAQELLGVPEEAVLLQLQNLAVDRKVRILMPRTQEQPEDGLSLDREDRGGRTAEGKAAPAQPDPAGEDVVFQGTSPETFPGRDSDGEDAFFQGLLPEPDTGAAAPAQPDPQVYSIQAYRLEQDIARRLLDLDAEPVRTFTDEEVDRRIRHIEEKADIHLDELQRRAVVLSVTRGILLISGGPGTGKTTTINTIIRFFQSDLKRVLLAAPTGRAAKRMTEATGQEAMTIHRLLGYRAPLGAERESGPGGDDAWAFDKNEENPLEADVVILDEMSMVDLWLFRSLLRAVRPGTKLILVGDANQLPSVGAGRVFGDLMDSGAFEVITLRKIFRQAKESDIIMNAHRILAGEPLNLSNRSRDFFFLERGNVQVIYKHIVLLLRDQLPSYVGAPAQEIQVLTPMRRGPLGAIRLNEVLQSVLNPPSREKAEFTAHEVTFRVGDKVMQTRNNYQIEWEVPGNFGLPAESGTGIFNGDCGVITAVDRQLSEMTVRFDENRLVRYSSAELEDLDLAYAITVHKSQGSEYPAVILPLLSGPQNLMNRNLLYTAVTRARKSVVILGSMDTLRRMEANVRENDRRTGLADRLREVKLCGY